MAIKPKSRAHEDRIRALEDRVSKLEPHYKLTGQDRKGLSTAHIDERWYISWKNAPHPNRDSNYPTAESRGAKWWQFWKCPQYAEP